MIGHLDGLWHDYLPAHVEKFPDLHDSFWMAAKQASTVKSSLDVEEAWKLLTLIDRVAEMWKATGGPGADARPMMTSLRLRPIDRCGPAGCSAPRARRRPQLPWRWASPVGGCSATSTRWRSPGARWRQPSSRRSAPGRDMELPATLAEGR